MGRSFLTREGESYANFKLIDYQEIDELQTVMRQIVHMPTGAQVMHLENEDPENFFCLSFKTLPDSSNGAAHILEHTVLCGSRKYPVKDPFFSMTRRSLNTYMNAMTGSDFTCYPAATQVEQDFYNLLVVYLDAVFHPLLKEVSFLQEGHRLNFQQPNDPSSPLEFQGIVYNEMKGALSSVDAQIWHEVCNALIPDLPYAYNAGGDPEVIPSLTHAQLIAFHELYYHPSRCLFFFYGNFPLQKHLDFIQEHALKGVQRMEPAAEIPRQPRFQAPTFTKHVYSTSEKGDLNERHIHVIGFLTTPLQNQHDVLALSILEGVLMDTDASPLKKALLDTGLCIQADCFLDTEMTEVPLIFTFRGCTEHAGEQLQKALFAKLRQIVKEGLDFAQIEAAIHQLEFSRTEMGGGHSPFGLALFMRSALAKQHGCAPEHALQIHHLFADMIEKAHDPHVFSPLIKQYLLDNSHYVRLAFAPDPHLATRKAEAEKARLQQIRATLSPLESQAIVEQNKTLEEFQQKEEGEQLKCLPKVMLADVPAEARHFPLASLYRHNMEIHHHQTFTNHILYADVVCDLPKLTQQELFDLQLLLILWPQLGVGDRDYIENLTYIHAHTGGISAHVSLHVQVEHSQTMRPSFQLHGKALSRKSDRLFEIFQEMLTCPRFDEKKRIQELIQKLAISMKNRLSHNAMRYATQLALKGFSLPCHINELWYGLSFYNGVEKLQACAQNDPSDLIERLSTLADKLLSLLNPNLILSCDADQYAELDAKGFYDLCQLPSRTCPAWEIDATLSEKADQARIIASPVAYSAYGFKTISLGHVDAPALQIATVLMENTVLHHQIRERGGAYGSGAHYNPLWGNFYFHAYRDPHISHTYHAFQRAIDAIAQEQFDDQDLEEAKLGIIQALDSPTSPGSRGIASYVMQRDGKTRQIRQHFRDELLALTKQDISRAVLTQLLPKLDDGVLVTFASQELLDKELPNLGDRTIEPQPLTAL